MSAAKRSVGEPRAVELVEEAVHLLRQHPRELAGYYLATGPFALTLLFAWAHVTWFAPQDGEVAAGALLLVLLFGVMKAGQHHFLQRLLALRRDADPPAWSWRTLPGAWGAQLRLQAAGIVLLPITALVAVPFGWAAAYFHTAAVLPVEAGDTAETRRQAWVQARLWPRQNHWALAILGVTWLVMFVNIAAAFYFIPTLATRLLGLKTAFAITGWSYFNTTFLFLVVVLTHLLVDPLIRTFYLLRVFYGQARRTGADLQQVLARERRTLRTGVLAVIGLMAVLGTQPRVEAAVERAPTEVRGAASPSALDRALDRVLEEPDFRWRLRPKPRGPEDQAEGMIQGAFRATFETLVEFVRSIYHQLERFGNWISSLLPKKSAGKTDVPSARAPSSFDWMAALQGVAYVLLGAVAILLLVLAWKIWRQNRHVPQLPVPAVLPDVVPDLRDENVQASHLPSDGWLDLARRQRAAGEWRLALRALFLATLARLAHERLLTLTKFKTNLDYERELRRRAQSRAEAVEGFQRRRREFEEVWYGAGETGVAQVDAWLAEMEARR